jgi:hypothetical protein
MPLPIEARPTVAVRPTAASSRLPAAVLPEPSEGTGVPITASKAPDATVSRDPDLRNASASSGCPALNMLERHPQQAHKSADLSELTSQQIHRTSTHHTATGAALPSRWALSRQTIAMTTLQSTADSACRRALLMSDIMTASQGTCSHRSESGSPVRSGAGVVEVHAKAVGNRRKNTHARTDGAGVGCRWPLSWPWLTPFNKGPSGEGPVRGDVPVPAGDCEDGGCVGSNDPRRRSGSCLPSDGLQPLCTLKSSPEHAHVNNYLPPSLPGSHPHSGNPSDNVRKGWRESGEAGAERQPCKHNDACQATSDHKALPGSVTVVTVGFGSEGAAVLCDGRTAPEPHGKDRPGALIQMGAVGHCGPTDATVEGARAVASSDLVSTVGRTPDTLTMSVQQLRLNTPNLQQLEECEAAGAKRTSPQPHDETSLFSNEAAAVPSSRATKALPKVWQMLDAPQQTKAQIMFDIPQQSVAPLWQPETALMRGVATMKRLRVWGVHRHADAQERNCVATGAFLSHLPLSGGASLGLGGGLERKTVGRREREVIGIMEEEKMPGQGLIMHGMAVGGCATALGRTELPTELSAARQDLVNATPTSTVPE